MKLEKKSRKLNFLGIILSCVLSEMGNKIPGDLGCAKCTGHLFATNAIELKYANISHSRPGRGTSPNLQMLLEQCSLH